MKRAIDYYEIACQLGNTDAMTMLAEKYLKGFGVKRDLRMAFTYFKQAAQGGNPEAQYNLAISYFHGHGTRGNYYASFRWFRAATEQGDPDAIGMVGKLYEIGVAVKQNIEKGLCLVS